MDTIQFLTSVWPEQGPYLTAIPISWNDKETGKLCKGFRHFPHDTILAASTHTQQLAADRENPVDVYFALGSVKEARQKKARVASNIDRLRCFWLDIDVKDKPGCYLTLRIASEQMRDFCRAMGLPKPLVVISGGGLHCYWPMTESIDAEKWQHYAEILKALTKSWGLLADHSRTADRASVLRPVGSFNWKTGEPREVRTVQVGVETAPTALLALLAAKGEGVEVPRRAITEINTHPPVPPVLGEAPAHLAGAATINQAAMVGMPDTYTKAKVKAVVMGCQQMMWQTREPNDVEEPQWYDMVGCLRHAERGDEAVHRISRLAAKYSADDTNAKLIQHEAGGYGPTLCSTFESHRPGGCDGCPHRGKIKTPLLLGRERVSLDAPKLKVVTDDIETEVELPPPPKPFKRSISKDTGMGCIVMQIFNELEVIDEIDIYPFDIYPSKLVFDEREGRFQVVITLWLPHRGEIEFSLPTGTLYDRKALATLLGNKGALPDLGKVEHLVQYMIAYIRELQKKSAGGTVYSQLGWRPDGRFVLPDRVVSAAGTEMVSVNGAIDNAVEWTKNKPRGSLDEWKQVVATYERPRMEGLQFGFGVGFAAPLFALTNFKGMIVSMYGGKGSGKSSAAYCANSIWGHPHLGWADIENDTIKAFYGKLGVLNNLPATYDEITNLDPEAVSDLCYAVSKGRGRQRLAQDGTAKENHSNWQTMMLTTANASLHTRLSLAKDDASAEAVRIFEYAVPSGTMDKHEADAAFGLNGKVWEHFGIAGPVYAQALTKRREWAKGRVTHWTRLLDEKAAVTSGERFWSAGAACVLAGFELANDAGLTNADIDRLFTFAVNAICRMRGAVVDNTRTPTSILTEYLSRNIRSVLTLNSEGGANSPAMIMQEPSQELRIRVETYSGRMFIDRAHIRKFCAEQSIDPRMVQNELEQQRILIDGDRRVSLGRGTKWRTGQAYCWMLDINHPAMGATSVAAVTTATDGPDVATQ